MLSVIVPVYNEHSTLALVVAQICNALPEVSKEIIIVDDYSTDGTREWLRANFPQGHHKGAAIESDGTGGVVLSPEGVGPGISIRIEYHEHNRGKGEAVNTAFKQAAMGKLKGILDYTEEPLVSSDFRGDAHSAIIDGLSTMVPGDHFVKVVAWYDNEWGYSCRTADLTALMAKSL